MRQDGEAIIFEVEHDWKKQGTWAGSDCPNFLFDDKIISFATRNSPQAKRYRELLEKGWYVTWQQTGYHGAFEESPAMDIMRALISHYPDHGWRVVKRTYSQKTEIIEVRYREYAGVV